jgi:hypothetical protein
VAELSVDDVAAYTGGRLAANDPNTQQMLDAALAAARWEVGWHVSPVRVGDVVKLDGPGGCKLRLPFTQKIVNLTEVIDGGSTLDLTPGTGDVIQSAQVPWLLIRQRGSWSCRYNDIQVTLDHGFTEAEAADWRQAILGLVDQMSTMATVGRPDSELTSKQVDDVVYKWNPTPLLPGIEPILAQYRLLWGWA